MDIRDEVTSTSFRVVVSEAEPYSFQECATQQVHSSLRITHITFASPNPKILEAYRQHHRKLNEDVSPATFVRLRTLCSTGSVESYIVACFPWSLSCGTTHSGAAGTLSQTTTNKNTTIAVENGGAAAAGGVFSQNNYNEKISNLHETVRLGGGRFEVSLPRPTDICRNVDLRLDVDGSVFLEVQGPGSVTLFGEQCSALIPEWLSHHFFDIGDDDEEEEEGEEDDEEETYEDDERDMAEMYHLIH